MNTPPADVREPNPDPLFGMPVKADRHLVGSKRAFEVNGVVLVSPAMWELMKGAESQEELRRLLESIPLVRIGSLPDPTRDPLPMTTPPAYFDADLPP